MEKLKDIRIGIIGVGLLGNIHNQAIQTIARGPYFGDDITINLEAVCDTREEYVYEYAEEWDVPHACADWHDLITLDEINAVYIATPTDSHRDIFVKAADEGKHIFVQKPLAFTLEHIQDMIEARDRNDIIVQVGHSLRNHPGFWGIRRICRDEEYRTKMGRLFNVHFRSDQEKPYTGTGFHPSTWRRDKKKAHAGTLYEHSIHDFDMLRYWFDDRYRFGEVFAKAKYFFGVDSIEDSVGVLAQMTQKDGGIGATLALTAVWHNIHRDARHIEIFWENAHLEVKYSLLDFSGFLEIEGEKTIEFDQDELDKEYRKAIGSGHAPSIWLKNYGYETLLFLESVVKGDSHPLTASLEDSKRSHEIVEACYKSSREHRPIDL